MPAFDFLAETCLSWKTVLVICLTPFAWRTLRRTLSSTDTRNLTNIPGPTPISYLTGHFLPLFSKDAWEFHRALVKDFGRAIRIRGPMNENVLYTYDAKAMYHILVKDQSLYEETLAFVAINQMTFGPGLLSIVGENHRKQRKMLNPVFSVAHLRHMVPTFFTISEQLRDTIHRKILGGSDEIEMVTWMTRAALEIVGQSGLGTSFGPVTEEQEEHPFIAAIKGVGPSMADLTLPAITIVPAVYKYNLGTAWLQRFVVNMVPWKAVQQMKEGIDTIHRESLEIFESKRKALLTRDESMGTLDDTGRRDIISILMRENMKASNEDKLTDAEVVGQIATLMFAATDTTSSAMARILHTLSIHQNAQDKLRAEIREARKNIGSRPNHDQLVNLPYLDAVCRETLRLYPPVGNVFRESQAEVLLPLSAPLKGVNGDDISEILLPRNCKVMLSIEASNRDPDVWGTDSFEWKPERWLAPLPQAVTDAHIPGIYSHLMTFLGGSRSCIGFKFSQLEMKVILFVLLNSFKFSLPKQEVFWQKTVIATPTTDPNLSQTFPDMPLRVSLAD